MMEPADFWNYDDFADWMYWSRIGRVAGTRYATVCETRRAFRTIFRSCKRDLRGSKSDALSSLRQEAEYRPGKLPFDVFAGSNRKVSRIRFDPTITVTQLIPREVRRGGREAPGCSCENQYSGELKA